MPPRVLDNQVVNWLKMYAELPGNRKKQKIKSYCDNNLGLNYIKGFQGESTMTHNVLIDPMHIYGIAGLGEGSDGAMTVKQYFVHSSFAGVNRNIYHSSTYAALTDAEYAQIVKEAVDATAQKVKGLADALDVTKALAGDPAPGASTLFVQGD